MSEKFSKTGEQSKDFKEFFFFDKPKFRREQVFLEKITLIDEFNVTLGKT